jgi:hypothetical protein
MTDSERNLYVLAGITALITVLVMVLEMVLTLLPGGSIDSVGAMAVADWFALYRSNEFMGLRNLGLMNMLAIFFTIPVYLALYTIHREGYRPFAALVVILFFIGITVYLSGNVAFSMLSLSRSYATAAGEAERFMILAAGKALLARGESHTIGTFLGFFFVETAGIAVSILMLKAEIFPRIAGVFGIIGYPLLLSYDVFVSFLPVPIEVAVTVVMIGGSASLLWNVLVAVKFLRTGLKRKVVG